MKMDNRKPHVSITASEPVTRINSAISFTKQMKMESEYETVVIGRESYTYLILHKSTPSHVSSYTDQESALQYKLTELKRVQDVLILFSGVINIYISFF